ncbi:pleiotropic drug resistance protein 3-like [Dioscorea cayenensis subsp. rotundata]|uniref:Pleiotropic drug resistance protein 3-like n=1 Tax=Dioscorea cayennensis subsp. rotundata TaxID=55577 RepID=A0AB40C3H6_DIOCR|nr:pleiotropic drug resistance protein 3-like [Dioscorea cayenensis subsp. rotundata]
MAQSQAQAQAQLEEIGRRSSRRLSFQLPGSFSERSSSINGSFREENDDEKELQWAAIERLPTFRRLRTSLFDYESGNGNGKGKGKRLIDVTKFGAAERRLFIESLIKHIENDNLKLLQKQKERIDRVDVKLPTIEVRFNNLNVEAECQVVQGKPLPTLWNAAKASFSGFSRFAGLKHEEAKITIIKNVSGIIRPSR